jgi:hypothetical protein
MASQAEDAAAPKLHTNTITQCSALANSLEGTHALLLDARNDDKESTKESN